VKCALGFKFGEESEFVALDSKSIAINGNL
jgi:hypothetical protein